MVDGGIPSILVANELATRFKVERAARLQARAEVMICADDPFHVDLASDGRGRRRASTSRWSSTSTSGWTGPGSRPGPAALELARRIDRAPGLRFAGIMGYEGHTLTAWPNEEKLRQTTEAIGGLVESRRLIEADGMPVGIVSGGGSGNHMFAAALDGLTELQAGGACFMDPLLRRAVPPRGARVRIRPDHPHDRDQPADARTRHHRCRLQDAVGQGGVARGRPRPRRLRARLPLRRARRLARASRTVPRSGSASSSRSSPTTTTPRRSATTRSSALRDGVVETVIPLLARGRLHLTVDLDLLIRGGTVVDGTGAPWRSSRRRGPRRDGSWPSGRSADRAAAATIIEAAGRIVAPGFIDAHAHSETALRGNGEDLGLDPPGRHDAPHRARRVRLGAAAGRCVRRAVALHRVRRTANPTWRRPGQPSMPTSMASRARSLSTSCRWRRTSRSDSRSWAGTDRPPTAAEMDRMRGTHPRLDGGRRGRAQHRARLPAGRERLDRRARRARQGRRRIRRRVRRAHPLQRHRQDRRLPRSRSRSAVSAGVPIRQSHESVDDETEPLLEEARQAGVDFGIDWYLYPAGSSHLLVWLPPEDQLGGFDATVQRLREDPEHRRKVAAIIEEQIAVTHAIGGREYFSDTRTGRYIGMSIGEVAARARHERSAKRQST